MELTAKNKSFSNKRMATISIRIKSASRGLFDVYS